MTYRLSENRQFWHCRVPKGTPVFFSLKDGKFFTKVDGVIHDVPRQFVEMVTDEGYVLHPARNGRYRITTPDGREEVFRDSLCRDEWIRLDRIDPETGRMQ